MTLKCEGDRTLPEAVWTFAKCPLQGRIDEMGSSWTPLLKWSPTDELKVHLMKMNSNLLKELGLTRAYFLRKKIKSFKKIKKSLDFNFFKN